jgi:hypothetical protein
MRFFQVGGRVGRAAMLAVVAVLVGRAATPGLAARVFLRLPSDRWQEWFSLLRYAFLLEQGVESPCCVSFRFVVLVISSLVHSA